MWQCFPSDISIACSPLWTSQGAIYGQWLLLSILQYCLETPDKAIQGTVQVLWRTLSQSIKVHHEKETEGMKRKHSKMIKNFSKTIQMFSNTLQTDAPKLQKTSLLPSLMDDSISIHLQKLICLLERFRHINFLVARYSATKNKHFIRDRASSILI